VSGVIEGTVAGSQRSAARSGFSGRIGGEQGWLLQDWGERKKERERERERVSCDNKQEGLRDRRRTFHYAVQSSPAL